MLMEQDPVNVFSPWNSFNLGTTLHTKENGLLNESDIFAKKNLFNHAPSNTSSYRHSDSSSPMSWSEVDNSSTSTGSRLSGIYDNGISQEISNLWNQIERDTNSGNLGLDHLKELASKDLSPCSNLYGRDTNECNSSLNPIGASCTTTNTYSSNLFGPLESYQKNDNFPLLDPIPATADTSSLFKDILQHTDSLSSSRDSPYWPILGGLNSYDLNDVSSLELSLANTNNSLISPFNPLPVDPNAQKNFLENLKRLRDLNELTSELNLDQSTQLYNGDVQFSPKDQSISQNLLQTGCSDMFYVNMDGNFCNDKNMASCSISQNRLATGITLGRNSYREKTHPSRQDVCHNQYLLPKADPVYGSALYSESTIQNNGIPVDLLTNPLQNISSNALFLPNSDINPRNENPKNSNLPGPHSCESSMKPNAGNRFQSYATFGEPLQGKESNSHFRTTGQVRPPIAGHGAPYSSGRNIDNSFKNAPPFRAAPQAFSQANAVSRPLRPYPPPPVEFTAPRESHELNQIIEDCYDQLSQLEAERKQVDVNLSNGFPGRKISSTNNLPIPRLPPSPSRVDRLIIDNFQEHSKVVTLVAIMQGIRKSQFHPGVHKAVAYWHVAILEVQEKRNKEIISAFNCRGFTPANKYDYDTHSLVEAIRSLSKACRYARTALFCAVALTDSCKRQLSVAISPMDPDTSADESGHDDAEDQDPFDFLLKGRGARVPEGGRSGESGTLKRNIDEGETATREPSTDKEDPKVSRDVNASPDGNPSAKNLDPAD